MFECVASLPLCNLARARDLPDALDLLADSQRERQADPIEIENLFWD